MEERAAHAHRHGDALKLIVYECVHCGHQEQIWNGHDGAAARYVTCQRCPQVAVRASHNRDLYRPGHRPPPGARLFIRMTPHLARLTVEALRGGADAGHPPSAHYVVDAMSGSGDEGCLVVVQEDGSYRLNIAD